VSAVGRSTIELFVAVKKLAIGDVAVKANATQIDIAEYVNAEHC
jgi:hypothetical protein